MRLEHQHTQNMKAPFQGLCITGVMDELCYPVEGSILRIHFKLSAAPPIGWAYLFSQVWQGVDYPGKRRVGIESDALWIECPPDEVRDEHLLHLEWAIEQTCERYIAQHRQKEIALEIQRELSRQTQMKLDELAKSFAPAIPAIKEDGWETAEPQPQYGRVLTFLRRLLGITNPPDAKPRGTDRMMHWKANRLVKMGTD